VTPHKERGRAFGFHRALDHLGALIGPLAATALLMIWAVPLRTVFLLAVIPAAIGVVLLVTLLREPPHESAPADSSSSPVAGPLPRPFWGAIASVAIFYLANSSDVFLILRAYDAGVQAAWLPLLWAGHHVIKTAFSARAGAMSDRIGRGVLLVAGWLSYAVIYLAFPFADSLGAFVVLFFAYAIPFTLSEGAERAWVADKVPGHVRGRAFGIYYLAIGAFTLTGTALFGWLYQEVSPRVAFHTGAAIAVIAAISVWVQTKKPEVGTSHP
jgi:MFS family permease